ncbi:MAG: CoB--CoM heterodisulfide reductase iron-sulfur subunit B family protein [Desulfobacterales bacterium]|uniref:CoB--CoM heterodisulfide reductase iron-sulfur subunit B family protein n=1 Tax=Candidatus Desulfaltia bathyphila TaxID=2841697 RepID=A0A8J6N4T2_9BACT|nr:CoB--CoM heterodisulfide reductase iron-sulfur subunit B family protein [Candidatus Desulfaltia bathyphila]MBL7195330.1 CoB--CoM heterodisulfide reductase iron-sulfur subunit B family protein [Desulfobacterales bacterium]MBL7207347.1 CoB--CoM heterodisulfide reductase iron-sulfur subunit B family protein [Desulfobacterales bacterium]
MKYALFLGCNIPARVSQYEDSSRAVLKNLGVELIEIRSFNCCGYPLKNIDQKAYLLSSAQNLALAEKQGLNILTLCKCCFGSLKKAEYLLKEDLNLRQDVNHTLADIGLKYEGNISVKHLLSVLYHDVGIDAIKSRLSGSYKELRIAVHYGCHALRPSRITRFDNPIAPTIFDELVEITGAVSVDWPQKLECCGAPLTGINNDISINLTKKKVSDAKKSGADYLCTACPFCHLQFDFLQKRMVENNGNSEHLASVLYPQLLGLCMGIDKETLGIDMNQLEEHEDAKG